MARGCVFTSRECIKMVITLAHVVHQACVLSLKDSTALELVAVIAIQFRTVQFLALTVAAFPLIQFFYQHLNASLINRVFK